jgi:bifunctional non-homologous end joining protein LigD
MAVLPTDLAPMLAIAGELPTDGARWAYEVKWDGVRTLVAVVGERVTLRSRAGNPLGGSYPEVMQVRAPLPVLLDGEVVAFDEQGRPDFGLLQARTHVARPDARLRAEVPVALVVFDVLHVDGTSVMDQPYAARRELLAELGLTGAQVPDGFDDGPALLASTRENGLEGVVAKRRDSPYVPGRRTELWVKTKHVRRQSAVVIGWQEGDDGRNGQLGSLYLAVHADGGWTFAGQVGSGFSARELQRLAGLLAPLAAGDPVCEVPRERSRGAHWVRPELVAEVEFTAWTRDDRLRHPVYKGLRADITPEEVVRE